MKNIGNTLLQESSDCLCEPMLFSMLLLHCFESQSNGLFLTTKHVFPFCKHISFILQCFENLFREIYFKEEEKYTKGLCICSWWKKQFIQQREMPKKAMSGKQANHSFLFSSKTQEWNLFPICRKDSHTAMSDSPHGSRSSEHAGRKFHLPWRGWNRISCDYTLMLTLMSEVNGLMIWCSEDWLS